MWQLDYMHKTVVQVVSHQQLAIQDDAVTTLS
jgi:hypothetical protein